jgi:hypothetical protein
MERFNETVLVLCKLMGWSPEGFLQHNVGTLRSRVEEHPPELIEQIRRNNDLDMKLHACANEFLDRAIAGYGPEFQTHRIELERANKRKRKRAVLIARVKSVGKILFGE